MATPLTQAQIDAIAKQNAAYFQANPQAQVAYQQDKDNNPTGAAYQPYQAPAQGQQTFLPSSPQVSNQSMGITTPLPPSSSATTPVTASPEQTQYWNNQTNSGQKVDLRLVPYNGQYAMLFPDGSIKDQGSKEVMLNFYGSGAQAKYWNIDQSAASQEQQPQQQPTQDQGGEIPQTVFETLIEQLAQKGISINPNVELTPEKLAEFLKKAEGEIAPYYASRLAVARDSILRQAGYNTEDIQLQERRLEQQYGKAVRQLGESAADRGFAQSGIRETEERDLAQQTQNTIDDRRRQLEFDTTGQASQFAGQFGTSNLPTMPTLPGAPRVLAGQGTFSQPGGTRSLYSLSPSVYDNLKGTEQFQERSDTLNRAADLESAYRTGQGIAQQRTLIL